MKQFSLSALALTVLFLVLYVSLVHALSFLSLTGTAPEVIAQWQSWLEPFLALTSVLDPPLKVKVPEVWLKLPEPAMPPPDRTKLVLAPLFMVNVLLLPIVKFPGLLKATTGL